MMIGIVRPDGHVLDGEGEAVQGELGGGRRRQQEEFLYEGAMVVLGLGLHGSALQLQLLEEMDRIKFGNGCAAIEF